jgi:hypothetical protein
MRSTDEFGDDARSYQCNPREQDTMSTEGATVATRTVKVPEVALECLARR